MHFGGVGVCWASPPLPPPKVASAPALQPRSPSPQSKGLPARLGASSGPLSPAFLASFSQPNPATASQKCSPSIPSHPAGEGRQDGDRETPPWASWPRGAVCWRKVPGSRGRGARAGGSCPCSPSLPSHPAPGGGRCAAASGGSAVRGNLTPGRPGPWALGHGPGKVRSPCSSNCLVVYFIQVP